MANHLVCLMFLLGLFFPLMAAADEENQNLPPDLIWQGEPVEPFCIEHLDSSGKNQNAVDLNKCSALEDIEIDPQYLPLKGPNYEYFYRDNRNSEDAGFNEYASYNYVGTAKGSPIIYRVWSGGGTGSFTNVIAIARDGDKIRAVQSYGGGDRCNGGVTHVEVKDDAVIVDSNVTPWDLVVDSKSSSDQRLWSLNNSATSCIGKIRKVDNKVRAFIPSRVDDSEKPLKHKNRALLPDSPIQTCFNNLIATMPAVEIWSAEQLDDFVQYFHRDCLK